MICKKCGQELKENEKTCSSCGASVEEDNKIKITYEDEATEFVDAPVITEAHTFIDEESFAKKLNKLDEMNSKTRNDFEELQDRKSSKKPFKFLLFLVFIVLIGFVGYYVVYPNIMKENKNNNTQKVAKEITSEEWTSSEFMINDEYYKLNDSYSTLYDNHWNFIDSETLELVLDAYEVTDEYSLTNSFTKATIKICLKNPSDKEKIVKDSSIWSVNVEDQENEITFELPGKIKKGSTSEEILSKYGKLSEDNVIIDEENKTTTYHYSEKKNNLDLIVYDEGGLKAFHYYFS